MYRNWHLHRATGKTKTFLFQIVLTLRDLPTIPSLLRPPPALSGTATCLPERSPTRSGGTPAADPPRIPYGFRLARPRTLDPDPLRTPYGKQPTHRRTPAVDHLLPTPYGSKPSAPRRTPVVGLPRTPCGKQPVRRRTPAAGPPRTPCGCHLVLPRTPSPGWTRRAGERALRTSC